MPIKEGLSYSDETQAAFVARNDNFNGDRVLVPEVLFAASRGEDGHLSRVYLTEGFGFGTGALYRKDAQIPHMLITTISNKAAIYINFPEKSKYDLTLGLQQDDLSVSARYFLEGRKDLPQLEGLVIEDKSKFPNGSSIVANTGYLPELLISRPDELDEILERRGANYDKESGVLTLRHDDMVIRANTKVPIEEILGRYFPPELRQDPLHAGIENDVWARSDWMADFGITWNNVVTKVVTTETPIFSAS